MLYYCGCRLGNGVRGLERDGVVLQLTGHWAFAAAFLIAHEDNMCTSHHNLAYSGKKKKKKVGPKSQKQLPSG